MATKEFIIDFGDAGEVECEVEYDYTKGDPGCHTMRNGDPGWPPTPAEVIINRITTVHGIDVTKMMLGKERFVDWVTDEIVEYEVEKAMPDPDLARDELIEWHDRQEMRCDD